MQSKDPGIRVLRVTMQSESQCVGHRRARLRVCPRGQSDCKGLANGLASKGCGFVPSGVIEASEWHDCGSAYE